MGAKLSLPTTKRRPPKLILPDQTSADSSYGEMYGHRPLRPSVDNSNSNVSSVNGSGTITTNNNNITTIDARPPAPPKQYISDIRVTAALPARPIVFHGRDEFVDAAVKLLTAPSTTRLAILGPGGIGKTTVAQAILYNRWIVAQYGSARYFLSCEALVSADAMVVSLAKLLGLPALGDLTTAVVTHLASTSHALLVLDNIESVWLVDGRPDAAVNELIGRIAQIPSLSLVITCRGKILPRSVEWSNPDRAVLDPFSLDAALRTFQDRAGLRLTGTDEDVVKQLLVEVDRMPLAVSILGQLAQRGNTVSELVARWQRERSALLQIDGNDRTNNAEVSIEISIAQLRAADSSLEALHLLSLCCLLPTGLHRDVYDKLRPQFKSIDRARDILSAYALANLNSNRVLKVLSPVRYLVLQRYPAQPTHYDALHSIYFDIIGRLPTSMDESFRQLAVVAEPEIDNMSSLLASLADRSSGQIVVSIFQLSLFLYFQHPTTSLVSALIPRLELDHTAKASCLQLLGQIQIELGEYQSALNSVTTAAEIFLELDQRWATAHCKRMAASVQGMLGEFADAEAGLTEASSEFAQLGDECSRAQCSMALGWVMMEQRANAEALEHLTAARQIFTSSGRPFSAAQCAVGLGNLYLEQDRLDFAMAELKAARTTLLTMEGRSHTAKCLQLLARAHRKQKDYALAEELLNEAAALYGDRNGRLGLATCLLERGYLMQDQERWEEAAAHINSARQLFDMLGVRRSVDICRQRLALLDSIVRSPTTAKATVSVIM